MTITEAAALGPLMTKDAARLAHCTVKGVQAAIHRGKLPTIKIGRDCQIAQEDFKKWMDSPRKVGHPRKDDNVQTSL